MSTPLFIWLGSGRARRRGVGATARLLDQAANAGLPVPPGAVLLDEFYRLAVSSGLARPLNGRVTISDAELWHNTVHLSLRLPRFRQRVAVYPVADGLAARAATGPAFDFNDAIAAARAVEQAWSAVANSARHDVLIVETLAAERTGTAITTVTTAGDAPPVDQVTLDRVGDTLALPQLRGRAGPDRTLLPFAQRLQQLLRGARRTLGAGAWRVAWADDGRVCWLTFIAPAPEVQPAARTPA